MDSYKITFETWNKVASLYQDKFMDLDLYNDSYDLFCQLIDKRNATILEIGCGPGNITKYIISARPDFKVTAIDVAPNMITLTKLNNPTVDFKVMDCREISSIVGKFDGIICGFCIPYLSMEDSNKLIKEIAHLLNKVGILYFSTIKGDYAQSGFETASTGDCSYVYYYNEEHFQNELVKNGFNLIHLIQKDFQKSDGAYEINQVNYVYQFDGKFQERNIETKDGKKLNGLLFTSGSSKGLIFYLHGGGYTLDKWGKYAKPYTDLHYDIFFLDYRGFGKSEGALPTEKQLYSDVQDAYNNLKTTYKENNIIVFGYSFGVAPASKLGADNMPKMLILQAPYYSGDAAVKNNYPFLYSIIPPFLLKYKLKTYAFVKQTKAPIVIFHGNEDSIFNISQSYKLKELFKPGDELIVLDKQGHNGFTENREYIKELKRVLLKY